MTLLDDVLFQLVLLGETVDLLLPVAAHLTLHLFYLAMQFIYQGLLFLLSRFAALVLVYDLLLSLQQLSQFLHFGFAPGLSTQGLVFLLLLCESLLQVHDLHLFLQD